jgi:osmotically-inducible protein OsmY
MTTEESAMTISKRFGVMGSALVLSGLFSGCALDRPSGVRSEDAKITANVQSRIDQNTDLSSPNSIYVSTRDHVVYLSGLVASRLEVATAKGIVAQVPGVAGVVSTIAVEP